MVESPGIRDGEYLMQNNRRNNVVYVFLAGFVIIFLVLMLALGGGGSSGNTGSTAGASGLNGSSGPTPSSITPVDPVIPKNTHVLSPATIQTLESVSSDNRVMTFSSTNAELQNLSTGNVIVSDSTPQFPYGFLRKVTRVNQVGGKVQLETVNTTLDAAIQEGSIHFKRALTQADIANNQDSNHGGVKLASPVRAFDGIEVQIKDIVVYDKDNNLSTTDDQLKVNGEFFLKPEWTFDLSIKNSTIQELYFEMGCATKDTISLSTSSGIDLFSKTKELRRWTMHPITVMVGPVPIVLVPVIILNIGADGKLSVGMETSVSHEKSVSFGFKKTGNNYQPFSTYHNQVDFNFPPSVYEELSIQAYFIEQSNLLIYGIVGPYSGLKGGVEGEIKLTVIQPGVSVSNTGVSGRNWADQPVEWATYLFLTASAGVRFDVFSEKLPQKEFDIITLRIPLKKGKIGGTVTATPTGQPVNQPTTSTNTNTVLLFDTSGSMEEPTTGSSSKLLAAIESGQNIINMIQAEDQSSGSSQHKMGIAHFSMSAGVNANITGDFSTLTDSLSGLSADGRTAMADGLRTALALFPQSANDTKNILVLLSDGLPNIGLDGNLTLDYQSIRNEILNLSSEAGKQGVCIYTVGFGEPGAVVNNEPTIDEDLLKEIASRSGCGSYSNAKSSMQLANVYVNLRHQSTGEVVLQKTGKISQGEKIKVGNFQVDGGQDQVYLSLNWPGSQLDVVLTDPQGRQVDANYSGASLAATKTLDTILIRNPIAGQWSFQAVGVDVPEGTTDYNAIVSIRRGSVPAQPAASQPNSGLAIFLILITIMGGGMFVYVRANKRGKGKSRQPTLSFASIPGQSVTVTHDHFSIGRGSSNDLVLPDRSVSRNHAELRTSEGMWFIQDLQSKGGTFVNGQPILGMRLMPGDRITIGKTTLIYLEN